MHAQFDSKMKEMTLFTIPFIGLKEGKHQFVYQIDKKFFEAFQYDEFNDVDIKVDLSFVKKGTMLELDFQFNGIVTVSCDISNELFNQPISDEFKLIVKFGNEYNDDRDDILVIPHTEFQLNISQYIYESIILAVPSKRIHPNVMDGSLKSEVIEKLKELEVKEIKIENIDPRWDKLKDLKKT
ncbi:MAG TPA: DUF177 domain-containing protein [Flavobacteriaceae bacterium]|nr:DUF177 domain-containing protein [Flavobacteriaceae bacterium]